MQRLRRQVSLRGKSGHATDIAEGPSLTDAVEKGFLGGSPSNIDSKRASNAQDRFKNSPPLIRLLRAGGMPGTFSTVSTQGRHAAPPLLDHLIGAGEQGGRDREAERLRGLEAPVMSSFAPLQVEHARTMFAGSFEPSRKGGMS